MYSISSGTAVRALEGHSEPVSALSMDAGRLASASADGTARLWDLSSGECLAKTHSSGEALRGVSLRGNFLATGCAANRASLFQLGEGKSDDGRTWKGYRRSEFDDRGEGEGGGHEGGEDRGGIVEVLLPRVGEMRHDGSVYCVVVTAGGRVASLGWNSTDLKLWGLDGAQLEVALLGVRIRHGAGLVRRNHLPRAAKWPRRLLFDGGWLDARHLRSERGAAGGLSACTLRRASPRCDSRVRVRARAAGHPYNGPPSESGWGHGMEGEA